MEFALTPEEERFCQESTDYLRKQKTPELVAELEARSGYGGGPAYTRLVRQMGRDGWLGVGWPEEFGGQGRTPMEQHLFYEICFYEEIPLPVLGLNTVGPAIMRIGTDEQKRKYLPPILSGELEVCVGYTEPDAGTDLASLKTTAVSDGDDYVINGQKTFITNGPFADFVVLLARTEEGTGYRGMSLFLVEKTTPGYSVSKKLDKVGTYSSPTAELAFEDCFVPEGNLLGERGKGFYHIMWELQNERIFSAVAATARAQVAYEMALEYAQQRVQFGRPIANLQVIRHKLADMATQLEAARQFAYHVAWLYDNGEYPVKEISMSKLFATEVAFKVADEAMQIHGGYGYMMDFLVQQYWRDIRVSRFMAGTSEIQKEIIAGILIPKEKS